MGGVFGAEVGVAGQIVGEEAETDFVGNQAAGNDELVDLGGMENRTGPFQVSYHQLLEDGELNADGNKVGFVLEARASGGAHEIVGVVKTEAGHDGIEVHDLGIFATGIVNHDVAGFGIIMRDTFGNFTGFVKVEEGAGKWLAGEG